MSPKEYFESKLRELSKCNRILDAGGGTPFQKRMAKYKQWFENCKYETLDCDSHWNPTIVGDIHNIPLKDETYDGVICLSVLEHLERPWDAINEIHRIMKKGGRALFYVPSIYPYHARKGPGAYPDCFRFMDDGLKFLFKNFSEIEIVKTGGHFEAISLFYPFIFKKKVRKIASLLDRLLKTNKKPTTPGYYLFAIK